MPFLALLNPNSASSGEILKLFADNGDPLHSQCLHAGLLWALETLAWHPSYLLRVSLILAELAERDTGKRWSNRPGNSLAEIFLPWLPHTAARVDERIKVLQKITEKRPASGWRLLLALLPSLHGHSMPTHTPKWRNWATNWRAQATNADYAEQVQACGDRLVQMVENDAQRWVDIIKHIAALPPVSRTNALAKLAALDLSKITLDDRKVLAEKLRVQIQRHRAFPDARWVLPNEDILALETALKYVEPNDPIVRDAWLFADHVELPEPHGPNWSWQDEAKKVSSMRQEVIATIFTQNGIAGLMKLAATVKAPWLVGVELANTGLVSDPTAILPALLVDPNPAIAGFARGYAGRCFEAQSWNWVEELRTDQWTAEQVARLATILPAARKSWDLLERHSDEAARIYWESAHAFWIKEPLELQYAISRLLAQHRPFAAVRALDMAQRGAEDLPDNLLLDTLEATLKPEVDKPSKDIGFSIIELLQNLQRREPPVDEKRLAQLEWAYIGLLDGDQASASTLHKALATDPGFFAELLRVIFRPRSEADGPHEEPTEQERNRAMNAYRLLHSWDKVPGFQEATQAVDGGALTTWIDKARQLCKESGHLEICDTQIGEILAHAPKESDDSWPCIAVRDVIEAIDSQDVAEGFVIGTLNQRGVTVRMPTDGGNLERAEALKYATYAKSTETEWPVTASILRRLADIYDSRARDEDVDAEIRRRGR